MDEMINLESVAKLLESIKELGTSLISLFAQCFGWLGTGTLVALGIGVGIAIALRIFGR